MKVFTARELHIINLLEHELSVIRNEVLGFIGDNPELFEAPTDHDIHETIRNCPYLAIEPEPVAPSIPAISLNHITESYGESVNYLDIGGDDYYQLKAFLEVMDVELRMISHSGETKVTRCQGRNLLREALSFAEMKLRNEVSERARHMKNEARWTL